MSACQGTHRRHSPRPPDGAPHPRWAAPPQADPLQRSGGTGGSEAHGGGHFTDSVPAAATLQAQAHTMQPCSSKRRRRLAALRPFLRPQKSRHRPTPCSSRGGGGPRPGLTRLAVEQLNRTRLPRLSNLHLGPALRQARGQPAVWQQSSTRCAAMPHTTGSLPPKAPPASAQRAPSTHPPETLHQRRVVRPQLNRLGHQVVERSQRVGPRAQRPTSRVLPLPPAGRARAWAAGQVLEAELRGAAPPAAPGTTSQRKKPGRRHQRHPGSWLLAWNLLADLLP